MDLPYSFRTEFCLLNNFLLGLRYPCRRTRLSSHFWLLDLQMYGITDLYCSNLVDDKGRTLTVLPGMDWERDMARFSWALACFASGSNSTFGRKAGICIHSLLLVPLMRQKSICIYALTLIYVRGCANPVFSLGISVIAIWIIYDSSPLNFWILTL